VGVFFSVITVQNNFHPVWQQTATHGENYPFLTREDALSMMIRAPKAMLDIGCGSGGVGYFVKQHHPTCEAWGAELDESAAQLARAHFDHVVVGDVETLDFRAAGLAQPFDLVCLLDVLEHLYNPWRLLEALKRIISDDAHLIVSLPNVSNILLMYDAYKGHWKYGRLGLLDFTHIRFFTDFDARKMFYQTGYKVVSHKYSSFGLSGDLFTKYEAGTFPTSLAIGGDFSVTVKSRDDLARLCAQQNIYVITPHHDAGLTADEQSLASSDYPATHAFGM